MGNATEAIESVGLYNHEINVFPHHFLDTFYVQTKGYFEYLILDVVGNEIEKGRGKDNAVLGNGLKSGTYCVQIKNESTSKWLRMMKNQ